MSIFLKRQKIWKLSSAFFGNCTRLSVSDKKRLRWYYYKSRCVICSDGPNNNYYGSFCSIKRCTKPLTLCKYCPNCIQY